MSKWSLPYFAALAVQLTAQTPVPLLEIRGPVPDTATSRAHIRQRVEHQNYVSEEYFVSGKANIYDPVGMADAQNMNSRSSEKDMARREFSRPVLKAAVPYGTRILVYKPRDASKFSGNVIVETVHPANGGSTIVWNNASFFFMANGDAYVAVQHPATFAGLRKFDPERYASLQMEDYTQLWGAIAQVGALLRSGSSKSPLAGYRVTHQFLTGLSYTGVATSIFANYHHTTTKLPGGGNIFDGYVSLANGMYNRPLDVPTIRVMTQSDFNGLGAPGNRRPDSDRAGEQYRLYELPGAPHSNVRREYPGTAEIPADMPRLAQAEGSSPNDIQSNCKAQFPAGSTSNDFPNGLFYAAVYRNLYAWVKDGVPPPKGALMEMNADGSTKMDERENAVGGVRNPYVDVPIAKYGIGKGACFLQGYKVAFSAEKKRALYGSHANYVKKVEQESQRLEKARLITPVGAQVMIEEARKSEGF